MMSKFIQNIVNINIDCMMNTEPFQINQRRFSAI